MNKLERQYLRLPVATRRALRVAADLLLPLRRGVQRYRRDASPREHHNRIRPTSDG
jgi:hypothetical protein